MWNFHINIIISLNINDINANSIYLYFVYKGYVEAV
ncbi:hypothetical protein FHX64_002833 [Microbacter margulisiae]|uniref:Uncharacterized protein n=1 Tax=Microbacter margulisiae TaxID=1350067 RepID=A0A7W5DT77_9PORP|nr:hypothetical protein [Microbacter margulisiae]